MTNKEKKFSGYYDKKNNQINNGDIVRFYFDADYGYGNKKSGYTEMIDICWYDIKDKKFYLMSDIGSGSSVSRHNKFCKVIGNVFENKELLKDFEDDYLNNLINDIKNYNNDKQN
jgi:hypothetical protein